MNDPIKGKSKLKSDDPTEESQVTPQQLEKILQSLKNVGKYGEVRLIVQNSRLKYINILVSEKAHQENSDESDQKE